MSYDDVWHEIPQLEVKYAEEKAISAWAEWRKILARIDLVTHDPDQDVRKSDLLEYPEADSLLYLERVRRFELIEACEEDRGILNPFYPHDAVDNVTVDAASCSECKVAPGWEHSAICSQLGVVRFPVSLSQNRNEENPVA